MGTGSATVMINCRKTVNINHTLVGWFDVGFFPGLFTGPIGWSKLSYTSPTGKTTTMRTAYFKLFSISSPNVNGFYKPIVARNEPGKWKFKVTAVAGFPNADPLQVFLLFGDVMLP